jgi:hypothetical protein
MPTDLTMYAKELESDLIATRAREKAIAGELWEADGIDLRGS